MPLLLPTPPAQPVRGDKRRLVVIGVVVAILFAGVAAWSAARPGATGHSPAGCVSLTIPSTTGGAMLRQCGNRARLMCRDAFAHHDQLSLLMRPRCRAARLS